MKETKIKGVDVDVKYEVTYSQESDSADDSNDFQFLKINNHNEGGGDYYIIETERWAVNEIDELIELLNDFKKRKL